MRVFIQKQFGKWAEKAGLDDDTLVEAAEEAAAGQFEADLGGYLYKKRLAREGGGKSGGFRTILCLRTVGDDRVFFLHGFPKNSKGNISASEGKALKLIAKSLVGLSEAQIGALKELGSLREIESDETEK